MKPKSNRGGLRNPPGGRPRKPLEEKRQKASVTLAPGVKELAQELAEQLGYKGWGYLLDDLIRQEAKR